MAEEKVFQYPTLRIVLCNRVLDQASRRNVLAFSILPYGSFSATSYCPINLLGEPMLSVSYPTDRSLQPDFRNRKLGGKRMLSVSYPTDRSLQQYFRGGSHE